MNNTNLSSNNHQDNSSIIQDVLYDKSYECPVCRNSFTSKAIRSGKNRVISTDSDLYAKYSIVNPLLYDVVVCTLCGYAALSKNFNDLRPTQVKWILDEVTAKYHAHYYPEVLTAEHAIDRYKLALFNAFVKKARVGERAYICLKIGWLYRDLGNSKHEGAYLSHAKDGFIEAFSSERFPIFELDELTTMYIIAELSRRNKDYDTALRWVSDLIVKSGIPSRLKNRALDLKDLIKQEKLAEKANEKTGE